MNLGIKYEKSRLISRYHKWIRKKKRQIIIHLARQIDGLCEKHLSLAENSFSTFSAFDKKTKHILLAEIPENIAAK